MFKRFFKSKHSRITEFVANTLVEKNNKNVKAAVPGFLPPQRVVRKSTNTVFSPEVTAVKGGQFRLFSIETKTTIHEDQILQKWPLFAEYATQNNALFYIVFPQGLLKEIKKKLGELNIEAHLWEVSGY